MADAKTIGGGEGGPEVNAKEKHMLFLNAETTPRSPDKEREGFRKDEREKDSSATQQSWRKAFRTKIPNIWRMGKKRKKRTEDSRYIKTSDSSNWL